MNPVNVRKSIEEVARRVRATTPRSVEHYEKALQVIPGGATRSRLFFPIPLFIDRGEGPFLYDIDGRRYIDCNLGFGTLILGHAHPAVRRALQEQVDRGIMFGPPVIAEEAVARKIIKHVPGAERVVFLNSGTEATWAAARIARVSTRRTKIAKFEGGWHGWHDFGVISYLQPKGTPDQPEAVPDSLGVTPKAIGDVVVLPYNDRRSLDRIRKEADDLACVIVEAVQGGAGAMPIETQILHDLRELTKKLGILLIVDEVITGFRIGTSGACGYYGVTPDMVTLGKVIGGGGPVGAIAGPAEIMDLVVPAEGVPQIMMFGTFSANPLTLVAGAAQLEVLLGDEKQYKKIDELGDRIRTGIQRAFDEAQIAACVTGLGSIWGYHFLPRVPRSRRDQEGRNIITAKACVGYLQEEGVFLAAPAHLAFLSTAHGVEEVDYVIEAHRRAAQRMKAEGFV